MLLILGGLLTTTSVVAVEEQPPCGHHHGVNTTFVLSNAVNGRGWVVRRLSARARPLVIIATRSRQRKRTACANRPVVGSRSGRNGIDRYVDIVRSRATIATGDGNGVVAGRGNHSRVGGVTIRPHIATHVARACIQGAAFARAKLVITEDGNIRCFFDFEQRSCRSRTAIRTRDGDGINTGFVDGGVFQGDVLQASTYRLGRAKRKKFHPKP